MIIQDSLQKFYHTTLSQCISACGRFLYAGSQYGDIFVFNIERFCSKDPGRTSSLSDWKPTQIFRTPNAVAVHSLLVHQQLLLIGGNGSISAYRPSKTTGHLAADSLAFELPLIASTAQTVGPISVEPPGEVNSMWLDAPASRLYAGCGDNALYSIDVGCSPPAVVRAFREHTDFVHSVSGGGARICTGSEDGTVRLWDERSRRSTATLRPHTVASLSRADRALGQWIGSVAIGGGDGDWLLCGGGPRLSLWHLRSLECIRAYERFAGAVHVAAFVDDLIVAGGQSPSVQQYTLNGELVSEIGVSGPAVYSAAWQLADEDGSGGGRLALLSLGGASHRLDVCTDLRYRDVVLDLYD